MQRSPGSGSAAAPRRSAGAPRTPAGAPQPAARGSEAVTPPQPPNVTAGDGDVPAVTPPPSSDEGMKAGCDLPEILETSLEADLEPGP